MAANPRPATARPTVRREALSSAADFPVLDAIFTRRSRRFPLGGSLTGPLAFASQHDPVSLAFEEEALLVAAATGISGIANEEWPFLDASGEPTSGDKLGSFTGRTYPSPLGNHSTELFWTNDDGVFCLPQRDERPRANGQLLGEAAPHELYRRAVRLQPERLDVPRSFPNLFAFNHQLPNLPGTTLFMPVSDVTRQLISAMLLYFDRPHGVYLYDPALDGHPLRPWRDSGWLSAEHDVDIYDFERWQMVDANGVEQGLMVQNLMLTTQALGLGGHPFSGGKGRVTMGGEREWHAIGGKGSAGSLGFTFHEVPSDAPIGPGQRIPVGLPGVFEAACPPFHASMDAAVDFVLDLRFGPRGIFTDPTAAIPWTRRDVTAAVCRPSDEAIACTKALCNYLWESYGRFPATIDPMLMTVWYQAHHIDCAFYDEHYPHDALPDHVRDHMRHWHG